MKLMNDDSFRQIASEHLMKAVYNQINQDDISAS